MANYDMKTAAGLDAKCNSLRNKWATRTKKFKDWYDFIELKDELAQTGQESVVSNDPRTGYNIGRHLLVTATIAHRILSDDLNAEEITACSYLERFTEKRWSEHERRYRGTARQGFLWDIVSWLMATGWYSIFSIVEKDKIWSEVWHPSETFPEYSDEGLVEVAHIYQISASAANLKAKHMGWTLRQPIVSPTTMYVYWGYDNDGDVANGIALGNNLVKTPQKEPELSNLHRLPVFVGPVGGLPDTGILRQGNKWQEHFGEAVVATNEDLGKNYNRMLTFIQQVARNAANPKWIEETQGDTEVLTDEALDKFGAHFKIGPGEKIYPLAPPNIPVELRQGLFDYQNMLQRGLFPSSIFGNIQQTMSYLAMANTASASLQVLTPYLEAIKGLFSDIDTYWYNMMTKNNYRPYKFEKPANLPDELEFDVEASIEIPGYLIQRATVARMLNPNFRLPVKWIEDRLFPEIKDPVRAQAQVRQEDAMMHPKAIIVDQILAYKEQARVLRESNNPDAMEAARLYDKLAQSLEGELGMPEQQRQPTRQQSVPQEVMPKELTEPIEGIGRMT